MTTVDTECACEACEVIRQYGWRAKPLKTFWFGLALGLIPFLVTFLIALVLVSR